MDLTQFNETLYPSGGSGFVEQLSQARPDEPLAMVYYTNGFTDACNDYGYDLVASSGGLEPHPNQSQAFYSDLLGALRARARAGSTRRPRRASSTREPRRAPRTRRLALGARR